VWSREFAVDGETAARKLQQQVGMYLPSDDARLNCALQGYPLSELGQACRDRIEALSAPGPSPPEVSLRVRDRAALQADQVTFLIVAYSCCLNHAPWFVQKEAQRLLREVAGLDPTATVELLRLLRVEVQSMDAALRELQVIAADSKLLRQQEQTLPRAKAARGAFLQELVRGFSAKVMQKPCADITVTEWKAFVFTDFEHVGRLVGCREVTLHKGTAYVQPCQLSSILRHQYEQQLAAFMQLCRRRLEQIGQSNTEYAVPQYKTILRIMHETQVLVCPVWHASRELSLTAQTLPMAIAQFAPLCIVKIAIKLRVHKHLVDPERVTLRLWLRAINVKLQVAVEFWMQQLPPEEDARQPITQAYAKKYSCVGCHKIRAKGLCPFQDTTNNMKTWCRENMPSAVQDIEAIMSSTPCALQRCGAVFDLRHGDGLTARMTDPRNPANYFSRASQTRIDVVEDVV
jgi:DNA primase large subunit